MFLFLSVFYIVCLFACVANQRIHGDKIMATVCIIMATMEIVRLRYVNILKLL